jgi:hypothetical protein
MPVDARNGPVPSVAQAVPEQVEMQAVRELLFGESQRLLDGRIQRLESQVAALERGLNERFRELSQRFEELARTAEAQHAALRDVGRAFSALGRQLGDTNGPSSGGLGSHVRKPE